MRRSLFQQSDNSPMNKQNYPCSTLRYFIRELCGERYFLFPCKSEKEIFGCHPKSHRLLRCCCQIQQTGRMMNIEKNTARCSNIFLSLNDTELSTNEENTGESSKRQNKLGFLSFHFPSKYYNEFFVHNKTLLPPLFGVQMLGNLG